MNNFIKLDDFPIYDLYAELKTLLDKEKISWHQTMNDQICINSTNDDPDNIFLGRGSLQFDWDNSYFENGKLIVQKKTKVLKEQDFTTICTPFKNTKFEEVYNFLNEKYVLGRVRIMKSKPKTCLTWHVDYFPRIHFPIKTQTGCFMVIGDEIMHLLQNTWWWTNTRVSHTAFNGSKEDRIHIVAVILGEK